MKTENLNITNMGSLHQPFIEKYNAQNDRHQQLIMLKEYMLSLSPEELKEFILEPIRFFKNAAKEGTLTAQQKKALSTDLNDLSALFKMKKEVLAN